MRARPPPVADRAATRRALVHDLALFSRACYPGRALRNYQLEAAGPILAAVDARRGVGETQFCCLFSRQAGKDELLAQLQAFLLARYRLAGGAIIMGTPTYKPQALVSRRRLLARLATPLHPGAGTADGYRVTCGAASAAFLSAEPVANVRGETADRLLIANEAQDITTDIWDARFAPMAASTNAPAVYSGTPWAAGSLLSRQMALAGERGTLFRADWERVAAEVPAYGDHVRERIATLGPQHPFILSEYGLQELDAAGGLFSEGRQAQMRGLHPRQAAATPGHSYALLLDVAGADETAPSGPAALARTRRDATALTVVAVDLGTVRDDLLRRPTYRVVDRRLWVNVPHAQLLPQLLDLARTVWAARWLVVDATGVGAGLASLLAAALRGPCEVIPFTFSLQSKSALGWAFLAIIESGRWKDYAPDSTPETGLYWAQVAACTFTVDAGPGKILRWHVPARRGHDDLLLSAALIAALDDRDWRPRAAHSRTRADW
jgi:hypothetical protein